MNSNGKPYFKKYKSMDSVDAHKVQSLQLTLMDNDILEQDTVQFKIPKFTTMWIHTNKILLRQQSIPKKAINSE